MTNHFHLLLEVPPPPSGGEFRISEEELTHRLGGLYSQAYVTGVKGEVLEARMIAEGKRGHFSRCSFRSLRKSKRSLPYPCQVAVSFLPSPNGRATPTEKHPVTPQLFCSPDGHPTQDAETHLVPKLSNRDAPATRIPPSRRPVSPSQAPSRRAGIDVQSTQVTTPW